jgi:hypothetical protein
MPRVLFKGLVMGVRDACVDFVDTAWHNTTLKVARARDIVIGSYKRWLGGCVGEGVVFSQRLCGEQQDVLECF